MWNKKILTQTIKENLASGNFDAVENACRIAFEKGGLIESERKFIKKSFIQTGDLQLKNNMHIPSIINYEYARSLSRFDSNLLKKQMKVIATLFEIIAAELTHQDLTILSDILTVIMDDIDRVSQLKIFRPAFEIEIDLRKKIQELLPLATQREESKHTFQLEKLLHIFASLKFEHLSPQERIKEVGKYLSEGLRRAAKKEGIIVQDPKKKSKE
jgi:hypothetical protein